MPKSESKCPFGGCKDQQPEPEGRGHLRHTAHCVQPSANWLPLAGYQRREDLKRLGIQRLAESGNASGLLMVLQAHWQRSVEGMLAGMRRRTWQERVRRLRQQHPDFPTYCWNILKHNKYALAQEYPSVASAVLAWAERKHGNMRRVCWNRIGSSYALGLYR